MPRLLALIPEDGWAMVREGETIFFVRPPFRNSERVPVSETTYADAVAVHGYTTQPDAPDEPWTNAVERIRKLMADLNAGKNLPSNRELQSRIVRSGPQSVLIGLLDMIEREWLAKGDTRVAEQTLKVFFAEDRVKSDKVLLNRALQLWDRLDELRKEKELRAPTRMQPDRIKEIANRPGLHKYKARQKLFGSSWMVA